MNFTKKCFKNSSFRLGFFTIIIFLILAVIGMFYTPNDPYLTSNMQNAAPSFAFPLGTDNLGRCIFSRTLVSLKWLFFIGTLSCLISLFFGVLLGVLCYFKKFDSLIMMLTNTLVSIPDILLILSIIAVFGTGLNVLIITIGFLGITPIIRVVRSKILESSNKEYIQFAKSIGVSNTRIITHHLMNDIIPILVTTVAIRFSVSILIESAIGYLGFSSQNRISIGQMTSQFTSTIFIQPYKIIPAVILLIISFSFYILADGILEEIHETGIDIM